MARSLFRLGICASIATLAAACGDGGKTTTTGTTAAGGGGTGGTGGATTGTTSTGATGGGTTSTTGGTGGTGATGGMMTGGGGSTMTSSGGSTMTGSGGVGGMMTGGGGAGGMMTGTGGMMAGSGGVGGMMAGSGGMMAGSGGMMTTGGGTGGSDQIATVRAAADGSGLNLPVQGVFVTYTKPMLGLDVAGFFVQGEQAGPAIFVAVDPNSLMPVPQVGDMVDFDVTVVGTQDGLKEVQTVTGFAVTSSNNPIAPLITEVSNMANLVSNLGAYESRAIQITGSIGANFTSAGSPQVASKITSAGLDDMNLKLRMPETVRATYDLKAGCTVSVDYGVMWRFNAVAQPSVYDAANLKMMTCPAPTVLSAVPLSATEVVIKFDRKLDPATVDAADFTFDNGLMAMNAVVAANGTDVTVTTSMDVPGLTYTVTVANLNDVLGAPIGMPNTAMFMSYIAGAQMIFNEVNPNITGSHDLIEFLVTLGGSTNGIKLFQKGSVIDTLATFPDVNVATGDLIVVHLVPAGATGTAPGSELLTKNQYTNALFSANYDTAWDFQGGATGLTFSNRVLELDSAAGSVIDAIPVVKSDLAAGSKPAAFPGTLQTLQAAGLWLPVDCGGMLCTYVSTPVAEAISVDTKGAGTSAAGNSTARKLGMSTKQNTD